MRAAFRVSARDSIEACVLIRWLAGGRGLAEVLRAQAAMSTTAASTGTSSPAAGCAPLPQAAQT